MQIDICKTCGCEIDPDLGCNCHPDLEQEQSDNKKTDNDYNPPPFSEGHNPFGRGGVYTPGDPGL